MLHRRPRVYHLGMADVEISAAGGGPPLYLQGGDAPPSLVELFRQKTAG